MVDDERIAARLSIVEALRLGYDHRHVLVDLVVDARDRADAEGRVMAKLGVDATQARAVMEVRLLRWTREERDRLEREWLDLRRFADPSDSA